MCGLTLLLSVEDYCKKFIFFCLVLILRSWVVHAFISSCLDYCNALYLGLSQSLILKLQLVQNAAARLLTVTMKREHITPVWGKPHWLPVKYRIQYMVLMYVFKTIHDMDKEYIMDLIHLNSGRSQRSFNSQFQKLAWKQRGSCIFSGWPKTVEYTSTWHQICIIISCF